MSPQDRFQSSGPGPWFFLVESLQSGSQCPSLPPAPPPSTSCSASNANPPTPPTFYTPPLTTHLSTPDHALATELVMGVLRWRSRLDAEIATASSQPLSKLDLEILIALRLALYQFRWLDRIPQRAALHESVELVKRARKRSAAPFVNAVLRKLSAAPRNPADLLADDSSSPESLARALAHPLWLVERWTREYGLSAARQICQHNQSIPTTAIRLRIATAEAQLDSRRNHSRSRSPPRIRPSRRTGDITKTQAFRAGQSSSRTKPRNSSPPW